MTKQLEALIARIKRQTESFDTVVLKEDEANALIAVLEQSQQQKDDDSKIKARLCSESNNLHDRLQAATQRIAELELLCDRDLVHGMKTGWNYCDAGNSEEPMRTIIRRFTKEQLIEKLQRRIAVTENYPDIEEAQLDSAI